MSLTPDMMPAWELREQLKGREDTITRLEGEVERLRRCLAKQPNTYMIAYQNGDHERLVRYGSNMEIKNDLLTAENERLRAALDKSKDALSANINQYAARDQWGNIVPGDEQYPWIKQMQIALDSARAALTQEPQR